MTAGVLLMAYGTPASLAEVPAYLAHIRRGRPPTPEQVADLCRRYEAIGGLSPLFARTLAQARALDAALGEGWRVALGMKHAAPFIEDGLARLAGCDPVVGLVLAPHYSAASVGEYLERAGPGVIGVRSWHTEPGYLDALADRVTACLARLPDGSHVVFTAHSLPARILDAGDPYPDQVRETAEAVAARVGLRPAGWSVAWQSAPPTPEPWLGPDVRDVIRDLAVRGLPGVCVCPCGFVTDHLETLYDLDLDAAGVAREAGIAFARTAALDDDPRLVPALVEVVQRAAR
jgi:ferrochelatase